MTTVQRSGPIKTDISMRMAAIGARGELLSAERAAGGMSLAIKTDAFLVEMESDAVHHAVTKTWSQPSPMQAD